MFSWSFASILVEVEQTSQNVARILTWILPTTQARRERRANEPRSACTRTVRGSTQQYELHFGWRGAVMRF